MNYITVQVRFEYEAPSTIVHLLYYAYCVTHLQ